MVAYTIRQMDEKDEKIANELISLGISRPTAWTLSYLKNGNEVKSVELERGTGLRQPEVSIVMRELKERDWINERDEKKAGRGRPYKIYSLKIGFGEIISELEKQERKAADEARLRFERLRKSRRY